MKTRNAPSPDKKKQRFCISEEMSIKIAHILRNAAQSDPITFKMGEYSFNFVYDQAIKRLLTARPRISQYSEILHEEFMYEIAKLTIWILLFDILHENVVANDLNIIQSKIYDRLSLLYSALRRKLASFHGILTENITEFWASAVLATFLQQLFADYPNSEFSHNIRFFLAVEHEIRSLLVGFSSPNIQPFHSLAMNLLSLRVKREVPKSLRITWDAATFEKKVKNNDAVMKDAIEDESKFDANWEEGQEILFNQNSRTGLIENALRLSGTKAPIEPKGRSFRKGATEISRMTFAKSREVMKQARRLVSSHEINRDEILMEICDAEQELNDKISKSSIKPLNFTFESFGFDQVTGSIARPGVLSPTSGTRTERLVSWRQSTKAVRRPKHQRTEDEVCQYISEAHNHLQNSNTLVYLSPSD